MAVAYLNEGATSFAAANWSDATGFADGATLVINKGSQTITGGLSQTAADVEYLDILSGFNGIIGGAAGALECDADGTVESSATMVSRIKYEASGGAFYFKANGANTLAHQLILNSRGKFYGQGGILKNVQLLNGPASFSETVAATGGVWNFAGGAATIDYAAATAIPDLTVTGGSHLSNRNHTALVIAGGDFTLDAQGLASTTLTVLGGRLRLVNSGTITALIYKGGVLDFSGLNRPLTITTGTAIGFDVKPSPLVTVTTYAYPVGKKWN